MDLKIGDSVGPWIISKILKEEEDQIVAVVRLADDPIEWVLKIAQSNSEYNNIVKYGLDAIEYGVNMPPSNKSGKHGDNYWFVMEKFDYDCSKLHTINISAFVESVVQLLKHLHHTHNVIHGDLKLNNVLHKNGKYRVCDFEAILEPDVTTICDSSHYNNYYYYSYGAEYKKPTGTYKYDFQALGYMLLVIDNNFLNFRFQALAHSYYNNKISGDLFEALDRLRARLHPSERTKQYFALIESVDWWSVTPPPLTLYDEIMRLFSSS